MVLMFVMLPIVTTGYGLVLASDLTNRVASKAGGNAVSVPRIPGPGPDPRSVTYEFLIWMPAPLMTKWPSGNWTGSFAGPAAMAAVIAAVSSPPLGLKVAQTVVRGGIPPVQPLGGLAGGEPPLGGA